jgi:ATP-dependent helicase/nuclease subunit B
VTLYDDAATPYAAVRRPAFAGTYRFDVYAHLARVAEWSAQPEESEE